MMYGWLVIKIIHVFAGVIWFGSALMVTMFILPTSKALGPQAGPFMKYLMGEKKLSQFITQMSGLNFLCGLVLYWKTSNGFETISFHWPGGIGLWLGMISGTFVFLWGHMIQAPNARRLGKLTAELTGPPTPDQSAAIDALQVKLYKGGLLGTVLLAVSLLGMVMIHI